MLRPPATTFGDRDPSLAQKLLQDRRSGWVLMRARAADPPSFRIGQYSANGMGALNVNKRGQFSPYVSGFS
jgi:hypothetical protein